MTSPVRVAREGLALVATLDDAASRNALSGEMVAALSGVARQAASDTSVRALVLRGANGVFCAGGALKGDGPADDWAAMRAVNLSGAAVFRAIFDAPVPVIAVVEGAAFGGGFGLACCADIVIAGPRARFALSETSLGLVPAQIAPFVIGRIGLNAAVRLGLTGEVCDAQRARAVGLADYLALDTAETEALLATQLAMIARCAPGANAATKALFRQAPTIDPQAYPERAADVFIQALMGEGQDGVAAFAAKREPSWRKDRA